MNVHNSSFGLTTSARVYTVFAANFFFSNAQILFQFSTSVYILNFISYLNLQTSVGFLASVLAACISGWKEFQGTYAPLLIPAVPICYFPAVQ